MFMSLIVNIYLFVAEILFNFFKMYKKFSLSITTLFLTLIVILSSAGFFSGLLVSNVVVTNSAFDVIGSGFKNTLLLDSSLDLIDTEVLARRIGSGLATAGLGGVGTGIGLVFSGLIKGFSWNPSLKDDLFSYAIFGFALTEAIGLFALMMAFMLLYA